MQPEQQGRFYKLLGEVMAGYGKALDPATMEVWFNMLKPFEPAVIRAAFEAYAVERPDYAPAPNGIAARCKLMDGRPDENEAWAKSRPSHDENESVVWTAEMSEAFHICKSLLSSGDEIGARMAFKDAYGRLVAAARANGAPVKWSLSEGQDKLRKAAVIGAAVRAGLLPAPQATTALLSGPACDPTPDPAARAQLATIHQMLADSAAEKQRRLEHAEQERMGEEMARDIEIQTKVDDYLGGAA